MRPLSRKPALSNAPRLGTGFEVGGGQTLRRRPVTIPPLSRVREEDIQLPVDEFVGRSAEPPRSPIEPSEGSRVRRALKGDEIGAIGVDCPRSVDRRS